MRGDLKRKRDTETSFFFKRKENNTTYDMNARKKKGKGGTMGKSVQTRKIKKQS